MVRFGICSSPEDAPALVELGFDYVEWPVRSTVGDGSEDSYPKLRRTAASLLIKPEAWNVLLPADLMVVGPAADHPRLARYLDVALSRVAQLGGAVVVFGSGTSRTSPPDWPYGTAVEQLDAAFHAAGEIAAREGLTIVIEPLNAGEANTVNTVADGARAMRRVNHPSVSLLADLYHIDKEGEDLLDTETAAPNLDHVHVAAPADRAMPIPGRDEETVRAFFTALKRGGYDSRISIECRPASLDETAAALAHLKRLWAEPPSYS